MSEPQTHLPVEPARGTPFPLGFVVGWSVVTLVAYVAVGGTAQFLHLAFGLWFAELFIFAAAATLGLQVLRREPMAAFGLSPRHARLLGWGLLFGAVNYLAWVVPSMTVAQAVFPREMVEAASSAQLFERNTELEMLLVMAGVSLAAPLGEELFFRGFMQRGLEGWLSAPRAVVLTSLVFSAFHFDVVGLVTRFELGVLFGLLAWKTRSLWPAIGAHAANNLIPSLLYFFARDEALDEATLPWSIAAALFLLGGGLMAVLVKLASRALTAVEPEELADAQAPVEAATAARPWLLGAAISVVLVAAFDWRGVQLNAIDGTSGVPAARRKQPEVKALRARARSGEVPISEYRDRLEQLK